MVMQLTIRQCEIGDISTLNQFVKNVSHPIENKYFETAFAEQNQQKRLMLLAFVDDVVQGYAHLNFNPLYAPFSRLAIPEIQDLYISPDCRCQGLGEQVILACERAAKNQGAEHIGIGVGISGDFGAAQRLYSRLGYQPDGAGVVFDRQKVQSGDIRPIDDRLCMMLVKDIRYP
jgi:GNAT superfamily N-acetyltransferase